MQDASGHVEYVHRSWPADSHQLAVIRRELSNWLAPLGLTAEEIADVVLAVDEAVANAVRHAYGPEEAGAVELTLWTEPGTLSIEVVDHGSWRPPVPDPSLESGRGIPLMNTMSDAVLIHYDRRGSRVLLRHRIQAGGIQAGGGAQVEPPEPADEEESLAEPRWLIPQRQGSSGPAR